MVINIHGCGRSGTKAITNIVAYSLCREFGEVKLNYEPYAWADRFCFKENTIGLSLIKELPFFILNKNNTSKKHLQFLKKLNHSSTPIINKFNRGLGHLPIIREITKPNLEIIIIRDLYDTLSSVFNEEWDFLSLGQIYHGRIYSQLHERFYKEAETLFSKKHDFPNQKIHRNAFYWFINNSFLLNSKNDNTIIVTYDEINQFEEKIATELSLQKPDNFISKLRGNIIHTNSLFEEKSSRGLFQKVLYGMNEMLYYNNIKPRFIPEIGSIISLTQKTKPSNTVKERDKKTKVIIPVFPLLDEWNQTILNAAKSS